MLFIHTLTIDLVIALLPTTALDEREKQRGRKVERRCVFMCV